MAVETGLYKGWRNKWILMSLACFGFAGLCYYDGTYAYPADNQKLAAFHHFTDKPDGRYDSVTGEPVGWTFAPLDYAGHTDWESFAKAQGWDTEQPDAFHNDQDIITQWIMLAITAALGAMMLGMVLWHLPRTLKTDDKGLTGMTGKFVPYDAITEIDKRRWESKGIAYVHYDEGNGETQRMKVDAYVFNDGDLILEEVEKQTGLGAPVNV